MDRFRRSWDLAKASFAVLRSDKELLLFPLLSFFALVVVIVLFAIPIVPIALATPDGGQPNPVLYALGFAFYVVSYTVTFFFQTALVGAALKRLDGGDPTIGDGLRIATSRLPTIIVYAVIAATVGQILRWISERAGLLGSIVGGVIGFAWAIATFLVVPVLAAEGIGPIAAIKRSASLLRQTWGEQLVGNFGIGLVFGLIAFVVILVGGFAIAALASVSTALLIVAIIALVLLLAVIGLVASALSGIYTASLYRYATKGDPGMLTGNDMAAAFRSKSGAPPPPPGFAQAR